MVIFIYICIFKVVGRVNISGHWRKVLPEILISMNGDSKNNVVSKWLMYVGPVRGADLEIQIVIRGVPIF